MHLPCTTSHTDTDERRGIYTQTQRPLLPKLNQVWCEWSQRLILLQIGGIGWLEEITWSTDTITFWDILCLFIKQKKKKKPTDHVVKHNKGRLFIPTWVQQLGLPSNDNITRLPASCFRIASIHETVTVNTALGQSLSFMCSLVTND